MALNVTAVDVPDIRVAVTEAVTEPPAVTVPDVGFTVRLKSNGAWTVNVYPVVRVSPPPMPLTVIGYVPAGVDLVVEIVIVLVHVGRHWEGAKDTLAPEGSPVALNVTAVDVPDTRVAVTVAVTEPPAITVPDVGFTARLKSNSGGALPGTKKDATLHWHRFRPTWICAWIVFPRSDIGRPNVTRTPDTTPPSPTPWMKYSSAPRVLMSKWVSTVYPM